MEQEAKHKRTGGRTRAQLRAPSMEHGLLNRADGSAKFSFDKTSILAAVFGPTEVSLRDEILDRATIKVTYKPKNGVAGPAEKEIECLIRQTLEHVIIATLHPRTLINVVIQVLYDDGSALSAAINAAFLALLDAGIPLRSSLAAVSCATLATSGELLLDPDAAEEQAAASTCVFAFDGGSKPQLVASLTTGVMEEQHFWRCLQASQRSTATLLAYFRRAAQLQYERT
ncbi:Exosome component 5 [Balamuthia mandrillaris]